MQRLIDTWSTKSFDDIKYLSDTKLKPAMLMGPELVADLLLAHYKIDKKRFSAVEFDKFKRYLELFTTI